MKKKLISGLFLMLWMALLIAAMVYPQGIFPVLAASGVWVACLLTWGAITVALAALIKNGLLWQELRASLLKTISWSSRIPWFAVPAGQSPAQTGVLPAQTGIFRCVRSGSAAQWRPAPRPYAHQRTWRHRTALFW